MIGWWLGAIVCVLGWILTVVIIGMPLGLRLLNRLPSVLTLRPQEQSWHLEEGVLRSGKRQRPFLIRAIYFVLIGWWFSAGWIVLAYFLASVVAIVTIGLSLILAFWMFGKIGAVTTLYRS